jgi:transcriptional regulator with XRE-family HTH domain
LAEKANLNLSVVGHIENGKREVGISKVRQLAEALGVQPGDLFTATNEPGDDEPR